VNYRLKPLPVNISSFIAGLPASGIATGAVTAEPKRGCGVALFQG
jgi:hypothetical protein